VHWAIALLAWHCRCLDIDEVGGVFGSDDFYRAFDAFRSLLFPWAARSVAVDHPLFPPPQDMHAIAWGNTLGEAIPPSSL
jgi:hypothetical protein